MSCATVRQYHIIRTTQGAMDLEHRVRTALAEGWQPLGSPFCYQDLGFYIAQAMTHTRFENEEQETK